MVSSQKRSENVSVSTYFRTEALNEWIKNIRSKKIFKKRQSKGQDLRAIAILTHTLLENQKVLRQKQKERSQRWTELKKTLENGHNNENCEFSSKSDLTKAKEDEQKKNEIKALWKEELDDIDNFINDLNSIKTTLVR
ncbi:CLUMA_CG008673, isoform A [Clunio marinus]|uniref:CLUMA_CG008673, isoform A n=1 Tax=Clunio marinus TaxID=568069 RepID=A0A1J1IAB7_9DIPT|nr:CLUMA_CG008673, isoform A [Clunio marinus]